MISQTLREVFVTRTGRGLSTVVVATDRGVFQIDGDGYARVPTPEPTGVPVLPESFRGRRIVEVRCNGEDIAIRLEDGTYISSGWQLDTRSGEGYLDVLFHGADDVDADFLEFFQQLSRCDEQNEPPALNGVLP